MAYVTCDRTCTLNQNLKPRDIISFFGREYSTVCKYQSEEFEEAAATNINEAFGLLQKDRKSYWRLLQKFALTFTPASPGILVYCYVAELKL